MAIVNTRVLPTLLAPRVLPITSLKSRAHQLTPTKCADMNPFASFVARGLASQNIRISQDKDEAPMITRNETKIVVQDQEYSEGKSKQRPIVLLFGWGGASHKNLGKYSSIYLGAGFTTVQYILPTRHIIRDTAQVPQLMDNILLQLEKLDIYNRPVYVHCLSDTGVMCYQGMEVARKQSSKVKGINIRGVVWDSCCGPRPEVTVPRVIALLIVNWMCCLRDQMGLMQRINSSYRLLLDRGWPSLLRKWKGKPVELSLIEGTWSGDFGRDHYRNYPSIPELFLYSNRDYYLPAAYLEQEALKPRQEFGSDFNAVRFNGSSHVAHLRNFKDQYQREVLGFTNMNRTVKPVTMEQDADREDRDRKSEVGHPLQPKLF